ncbi:MAG: SRPBCC family protein [Chitinophagaceae bacterium]
MIILYIILGIVAFFLIAGLLIPKAMTATREIIINKPNDEVFNYIKYLKNQQYYSKWSTLDPNMINEFSGTDAMPGFINAWEGNKKVGKGAQEIIAIAPGRLDTELRFEKPFKSVAKSFMTTEPDGQESTKVKWGFAGSMNYPMNAMKLFMNMEKSIGEDFSTGLSNLKAVLEK